jgi:hypothetical protein
MGGLLAEPGHSDLFGIGSRNTTLRTERAMYFQDGGYMVPRGKSTGITVLARYSSCANRVQVHPSPTPLTASPMQAGPPAVTGGRPRRGRPPMG